LEHDLFGKPASTFPDHALTALVLVFQPALDSKDPIALSPGRLAERQSVQRNDFFPGQLAGGTPAHAANIARHRQAATARRGAGCDARPRMPK
jgi:hypothetical protein